MGRSLFRVCASRAVPVLVVALLAGEIRAADWPRFRVAGAGAGRNPFRPYVDGWIEYDGSRYS